MKGKRLFSLVVGLGWLLAAAGAFAGSDQPVPGGGAPVPAVQMILHLYGAGADPGFATGLNLAVIRDLDTLGGIRVVPRALIMDSLRRHGRYNRATGQFFSQDIPLIAVEHNVSQLILGQVANPVSGLYKVTLRGYSPVDGSNRSVETVEAAGQDMAALRRGIVQAVHRMAGLAPPADLAPVDGTGLSASSLLAYGHGWNAVQTGATTEAASSFARLKERDGQALKHLAAGGGAPTVPGRPVADPGLAALLSDVSGRNNEAIAQYERILAGSPKDFDALLGCARVYLEFNQVKKAREYLSRAEAVRRDDPQVAWLNARAAAKLGDSRAALAYLQKGVAQQPAFPEIYEETARLLEGMGRTDDALQLYREALGRYQTQADQARVQAVFDRMFALHKGVVAVEGIDLSMLSREQIDRTLVFFENRPPAAGGGEVDGFRSLIAIYLEAGRETDAAQLTARALNAFPNDFRLLLLAGVQARKASDLDAAIRHLSAAAKIRPDDTEALEILGDVYLKAEFFLEAKEVFQKLLLKDPDDERLLRHLGDIHAALGDYEKAVMLYNQVTSRNPDDVDALVSLARAYKRLGKMDDAKLAYGRARALDMALAVELTTGPAGDGAQAAQAALEQKLPLELTFPSLIDLVGSFPGGMKRVALLDMARLRSPGEAFAHRFLCFRHVVSDPVGNDLAKILAEVYRVEMDETVQQRMAGLLMEGQRDPENLAAAAAAAGADGIFLFSVPGTPSDLVKKNGFDVKMFLYVVSTGKAFENAITIQDRHWDVIRANVYGYTLPVAVLLLIGLWLGWARWRGWGSLLVEVDYDHTYEQGYFGVRLSRRELKEAFNVKKIMNTKGGGDTTLNTQELIQDFFASPSRYIQSVADCRAVFPRIPAGSYHCYLTGIMVNIQTHEPIGAYEVSKRVEITKNGHLRVPFNLRVTEAYCTVKAVLDGQPVSGAAVEPDGKQAATVYTDDEQPATLYLAMGRHVLVCRTKEHAGVVELDIDDAKPREIVINLFPARFLEEELAAIQRRWVEREQERAAAEADGGESPDGPEGEGAGEDRPAGQEAAGEWPGPQPDGERPAPMDQAPSADRSGFEIERQPLFQTGAGSPEAGDIGPLEDFQTTLADEERVRQTARAYEREVEVDIRHENGMLIEPDEEERERLLVKARWLIDRKNFRNAAELLLAAGRFEDAAEACHKSGDPQFMYRIYGFAYMRDGKYEEAREMFRSTGDALLEAAALERMRLFDDARRLRGEHFLEHGEAERAIEEFRACGAFDRIGDILETEGRHVEAGEAFLKGRRFDDAGRCFLTGGDMARAAEALEQCEKYGKAAELYDELGMEDRYYRVLEKSGSRYEAAAGYAALGMENEAIRAAQAVESSDPFYLDAIRLLAGLFVKRGDRSMAERVYQQAVDMIGRGREDLDRLYDLAVEIEEKDLPAAALLAFERVQVLEYGHRDVAARIEALQQKAQSRRRLPTGHGTQIFTGSGDSLEFAQTKSDRYLFERELGRGAMGVVYLAKDTLLERQVAYKTIAASIKDNPVALKYFLAEAKSLAKLNHKNVVMVFDVGQSDGNYFITMEFVEGTPLDVYIRKSQGGLSLKNIVLITRKVCAGLEYAHGYNIIHRDIKPNNIMVTKDGEVKIMDFGLAKIIDEAMADKTMARGTPLYMAPEQIRGFDMDHRADLYALGITVYEMATGRAPFIDGDIPYHHIHTPPPPPSRFRPDINPALEQVILRAIAKNKEDRFANAAEMRDALTELKRRYLD